MTYPWKISGTTSQQTIILTALGKIKFPFDRMRLPAQAEIGWDDLNAESARADAGEPLVGRLKGRKYILGLFYPSTGSIYIDVGLENEPEIAESVVSAEVAHAVDEYLPLSDAQRGKLMALVHPVGADSHSWWEKSDYEAEYYSLVGESFMIMFTRAYSDVPFGNAADFVHPCDKVAPADIRAAIGIERTDAAAQFVRFPGSKVYHKRSHYPAKANAIPVTSVAGLRPCKVCKPT